MKVLIVATMPKRLHPVYLCSPPHPTPLTTPPPTSLLWLPYQFSDHAFSTSSFLMIPTLTYAKPFASHYHDDYQKRSAEV